MFIANASMFKIISDPIINNTIGSSAKINTKISPCNSVSVFLAFYDFVTKSIQNNQNLKFSSDSPNKINLGIAL